MNTRQKLSYTTLGAALMLGGMLYAAISPSNAQRNDYGTQVDAVIDAVRKGEFSTVKTLIEGDRRLANARALNGTRSVIQIAAETGGLASPATSENRTVSG